MVQLYVGKVVRVLLGLNALLMVLLALQNVDSIWLNGPYVENVFMSLFAGLVAWICVWAAVGRQIVSIER